MAVFVRAGQKDYLEEVIEKVLNCGRGAALMTGAKFSFKRAENTYFDIKRNDKLNAIMTEQLAGLGITGPGGRRQISFRQFRHRQCVICMSHLLLYIGCRQHDKGRAS